MNSPEAIQTHNLKINNQIPRKVSTERWANESTLKNVRLFPQEIVLNSEKGRRIRRVCLTGGPCAGKSSALLHVKQALEYEQIHVIIVPEASTLLYTNSLNWRMFCRNNTINFQLGLLKTQLALEGIFTETSKSIEDDKDVLVLCDRGCMDGSA